MTPSDQPPARVPSARSPARRILSYVERMLALCFLFLLFMIVSPTTYWLYLKLDCQDPLRHADYIVCLGGDSYRVLEGVTLLKEGHAEKLILSNYGLGAISMQEQALAWGAPGDRILIDNTSHRTADHPSSVAQCAQLDLARDTCIIVTSFSHMARSKACFQKAGYKHLIMREPRWERIRPEPERYQHGFWIVTRLLYEYAAWTEYWLLGYV